MVSRFREDTEFTDQRRMDKETFFNRYAGELNRKQIEAVTSVEGPVLLLAVPGSGKTTVLVTRLGYMIYCRGIDPGEILTITYTVAATEDMARRFETIFGDSVRNRTEFRTINGICAKIIQRYGAMIGKNPFELITDEKETGRILLGILAEKMQEYPTESDVKAAKTLITYCKNMMLSDEEIKNLGKEEQLPLSEIFDAYQQYLRENRKMDYDDQMVYACRMLEKTPRLLEEYRRQYRYLCVDEAQDTSKIQHRIIRMLAGEDGNLFMVGDEDQSIYGFRAAYPEALLDFEKVHPHAKVIVMNRNYRSQLQIVEAAERFIRLNRLRYDKGMEAARTESSKIECIDLAKRADQYEYLLKMAEHPDRETAVLYRENESALPLIDQLERRGIPYRLKSREMPFFTNRVVADVTDLLRFALDPYDTELFLRIYYKCRTYLNKKQAEMLCRISGMEGCPVLDAVGELADLKESIRENCEKLAGNLRKILDDTPGRALQRIEQMGYREYLEQKHLDQDKLFLLHMLARGETSVSRFLHRLEELRELVQEKKPDFRCRFILSTIHSAKGLEFDRVCLIDVCDGIFPGNVPEGENALQQQQRDFEEERRLFYVAVTRAKEELILLRIKSQPSQFFREFLYGSAPKVPKRQAPAKNKELLRPVVGTDYRKEKPRHLTTDFELVIGERVIHKKYGAGVVSDAQYDEDGKVESFTVEFDFGQEKQFLFPMAFLKGMSIENGTKVHISSE